jgi:hypothetical protein
MVSRVEGGGSNANSSFKRNTAYSFPLGIEGDVLIIAVRR